jgi:hypothetical protein
MKSRLSLIRWLRRASPWIIWMCSSYIISGLDEEYDGFVATVTTLIKVEKNVSLSDVYSQFMSYEARMESRK